MSGVPDDGAGAGDRVGWSGAELGGVCEWGGGWGGDVADDCAAADWGETVWV